MIHPASVTCGTSRDTSGIDLLVIADRFPQNRFTRHGELYRAARRVSDERVLGGKPVIKRTRVPVQVLVGSLAGGKQADEMHRAYVG